jgi:hypothetical protein
MAGTADTNTQFNHVSSLYNPHAAARGRGRSAGRCTRT